MDPLWLQHPDPLQARDLTLEAAQAIGIGKALKPGSSSRNIPFAKLKALLDSRNERDTLDGLRRVVSMIYQNKPCLPYFSSVVKNVANPNIEIKKLVYIYLLHYAESDQDLALLSVNAIQKSLTDQNPQVRALALRTMAGMRVPLISQIVSLGIKRAAGDMSPHVRKAAALSIPKCYSLDPNTLPQLTDNLSTLLGDKQYFVVGPAVQSFLELCPDRIDLIHKHYRGLVRKLVDMDEWSQLATTKLLTTYARKCFPRKTQKVTKVNNKGFYDDEKDDIEETEELRQVLDTDLDSFLKACRNLLTSRSPAIITAVASVFLHLATADYVESVVGPLVSLLREPCEMEQAALYSVVPVALDHPELFVPYSSRFFLTSEDIPDIWQLKLEMLTIIFPHAQMHLKSLILSELEHYSHSADVDIVRETVRAIGRCAQSSPDSATSARCFSVLLNQVSSFDNVLVSEVLTVMRHLIQQEPTSHQRTVVRLARNLDQTTSPQARATIIWLVGEYATVDTEIGIAADVLRILLRGFVGEEEEAKLQIVLLAAKVYLLWLQSEQKNGKQDVGAPNGENSPTTNGTHHTIDLESHPIPKLWDHVMLLARYDTSYDLRDRARLFKNLFSNPESTQLAALLLLAPKPVPHTPSPSESRKGLMLGSTSLILDREAAGVHGLPGYEELPEWVEEGQEPDPKLRDGDDSSQQEYKPNNVAASQKLDEAVKTQGLERVVNVAANRGKGTKAAGKSLDDWLAESDGESEDESDSGEYETESEDDDESEEESEQEEDEQRQGLMK